MNIVRAHQTRIVDGLKRSRDIALPLCLRRYWLYVLLQNWLFQGFIGSHWRELLFRITSEAALVTTFACGLSLWLRHPVLYGILISHTLMWIFNGHLWALKINGKRRLARNTPDGITNYIAALQQRMERAAPIAACVLSGSLATGHFHEYSDLDIWLTAQKGFANGLWTHLIGVRERTIAFFHRIPIELYVYHPDDCADRPANVRLLLLKDSEQCWRRRDSRAVWLTEYPLRKMAFFRT